MYTSNTWNFFRIIWSIPIWVSPFWTINQFALFFISYSSLNPPHSILLWWFFKKIKANYWHLATAPLLLRVSEIEWKCVCAAHQSGFVVSSSSSIVVLTIVCSYKWSRCKQQYNIQNKSWWLYQIQNCEIETFLKLELLTCRYRWRTPT